MSRLNPLDKYELSIHVHNFYPPFVVSTYFIANLPIILFVKENFDGIEITYETSYGFVLVCFRNNFSHHNYYYSY